MKLLLPNSLMLLADSDRKREERTHNVVKESTKKGLTINRKKIESIVVSKKDSSRCKLCQYQVDAEDLDRLVTDVKTEI